MLFSARLTRISVLSSLALALLWLAGCGGYGSNGGGGGGGGNAPSAPTGLTATVGNAQVALNWTASSGATGYYVKRSTTSGAEAQIVAQAATTYSDTAVTNGTKYFYVVSAYNSYGASANSTEVSATPTLPVPAAPIGLTATAGDKKVALAWTAVTGTTNYNVKRSTSSGAETTIASPAANAFTDAGLTDGTKYFYVVSAVNASGEGTNSTEVNATPQAGASIPAAPTNLVATPGNATVGLTWTASTGATSYHVKRSTTNGSGYGQVGAPATANFADSGLINGTTYYYVVTALNSAGESGNSNQATATPANAVADVIITIDPAKTKPISPYIYGTNFYSGNTSPQPNFTFDRDGGNRWTAYNWETNASNAGSDYIYNNDNYLSSSNVPAEAVRGFIAADQNAGLASLVTIQLQGYVSADENGPVDVTQPLATRLAQRFRPVVDKKSTASIFPFTTTPPPVTTDANVYMDEFVWALDQKLPAIFGTSPTHPTFISLDNEPELWNSTHLEVQGPNPVTSDNYITKTINLSKAIKDQFPNAVIFGPVHYGFQGIYNWQGELSATPSGTNWFPDKYLQALKTASTTYGKPLVDVYDFHWYAEVYDNTPSHNRIINLNGTALTDAQIQLIVQSPRNLWDPTFHDDNNSNPWIYQELGNTPINLLGRLQAKIAAENPGMKLSITEYENGGFNHIAGTIAQADNLGIFGSMGIFAANFWPPGCPNTNPSCYSYTLAGFRAFRGFDGGTASFGSTSLQATSSDVASVVVYASSDPSILGRVVFVAINRSNSQKVTAINGQALSGTAHLYQMTGPSAATQTVVQPLSLGTMAVSGSSMTVTLPAYSVTTIDIE
jgi:fibronectin type 3 domain-containing protein